MSRPEAVLSDGEAFGALVDAHYPVTAAVAGFLAGPAEADAAVERTWLAAAAQGLAEGEGVRPWLFRMLLAELERAGALDRSEGSAPPDPGAFEPAGDRWAGWWSSDVATWAGFGDESTPAEAVRSAVVETVRSLPMLQRIVVLLRDTGGLTVRESGAIIGRSHEDVLTLLDWARSSVQQALDRSLQ